jgi:hypothetical protein
MQLSSSCSVGTLINIGEGLLKSLIVFIFFLIGSTLSFQNFFYDWYLIVSVSFLLFLFCFIFEFVRYKRSRSPTIEGSFTLQDAQAMMLDGYDSDSDAKHDPGYALKRKQFWIADFGLALLVTIWFVCVGKTIDVVGGIALLGSRIVGVFGGKPEEWEFWKVNGIAQNLMRDPTFLSNVSIILGALIGSVWIGKFGTVQENEIVQLIKGAIGGLCLGIGGIMSGGCTISGLLSGICASAPSGFVWLGSGIMGSGMIIGGEALYRRVFGRTEFIEVDFEK